MNTALIKKEFHDIIDEKLYLFAFLAQLAIVLGVLYAALLYTTIAAPETSSFIQTAKPVVGILGDDTEITAKLQKDLSIKHVSGDPFTLIKEQEFVAVLWIKSEKDFDLYLDNTKLLSGYAETVINSVLSERSSLLKRAALEEKMETADIVLNPILLNERRLSGETSKWPPEFIVVMYGLLIPFILLLPTFLATNMVTDSIVGEKERKTYEVLVAAPLSKRDILISKILPIITVALIQSFIWMLLLRYKELPIYNIPLLLLLLLIINVIFIGFGVLLSAFSDTLKESNLSVTVLLLISSIAMFAPIPLQDDIRRLNPLALITKLASNPQVSLNDLAPIIPLTIIAFIILILGKWTLEKKDTLRL